MKDAAHKRLLQIWHGMRHRCTNPKAVSYKYYGARGIGVGPEWERFCDFKEWALGHGYASHLTIDRRNNDKGYCPRNCKWSTRAEQSRNRRVKPRQRIYRTSVYLGGDAIRKARAFCIYYGLTLSELFERLITEEFKRVFGPFELSYEI